MFTREIGLIILEQERVNLLGKRVAMFTREIGLIGEKTGKGKYTWKNGNVYEGDLVYTE